MLIDEGAPMMVTWKLERPCKSRVDEVAVCVCVFMLVDMGYSAKEIGR